MGDLTKNLSRYEFECKCGCGLDTIDYMLVKVLQELCDYYLDDLTLDGYKVVIGITGPNRCKEHNEVEQMKVNPMYIPYSSKSLHMDCRAADFKIYIVSLDGESKTQVPQIEIYNYLDKKYPDTFGMGLYHNRVHLDSRSARARWDNVRKEKR